MFLSKTHIKLNFLNCIKFDVNVVRTEAPTLVPASETCFSEKVEFKCTVTMTTKPKRNELIVYGYVHDIEKQKLVKQIIPSSIADVIIIFYPWIAEFKWHTDKHGNNARIVDDVTIESIEPKRWAVCISPHEISSDICNCYEWEFKLNNWSNNIGFEFGYVATPINEKIIDWNDGIGNNEEWEHYTINICVFTFFRLFGKNKRNVEVMKHDNPTQTYQITVKTGDRFKVRIDFKDKDIKLYYNDQFVNSVYKNEIPDSVVAAASIYDGSITVTKTNYE